MFIRSKFLASALGALSLVPWAQAQDSAKKTGLDVPEGAKLSFCINPFTLASAYNMDNPPGQKDALTLVGFPIILVRSGATNDVNITYRTEGEGGPGFEVSLNGRPPTQFSEVIGVDIDPELVRKKMSEQCGPRAPIQIAEKEKENRRVVLGRDTFGL